MVNFSFVLAVESPDLIIVNSANWEDVYSSLLYGSLSNTKVIFLSDQTQTNLLFNSIDRTVEQIMIIESDSRLSPTASKILDSLGYEINLVVDDDISLYLSSLVDVDSYILINKDFPSNGLSVAPYAVSSNSWVFFVDSSTSTSELADVITNEDVLVFGSISQALLGLSKPYKIIDRGNRYKNSVELSKLFLAEFPTKQFILTEGTFLEEELFIGSFPVLIVGVSSTPKPIEDFFVESNVQSAVVVGQASVPASMSLKRMLKSVYDKDLKLVAKLGTTSPDLDDDNSIIPLNIFPLPSPHIELTIESLFYNQITNQLELRFSNIGDIRLAYTPVITIVENGETIVLDSPEEYYLLEKSESRTIQFPLDLNSFESVSAKVTVVYGESKDSFEYSSSLEFDPLDVVSIADNSDLFVQEISYDFKNKVFLITVKNNGSVPSYADINIVDMIVDGDIVDFSSQRPILIQPGDSSVLVIYGLLSSVDIIANPYVFFTLTFGQRVFALIKFTSGTLPFKEHFSFGDLLSDSGLIIGVGAVIMFSLLLFLLLRKKKEFVCLHCGEVHNHKPKRCKSCGFGRLAKK